MPAYFKFLTVMAFYVFLQEKVDVAIMEVGIGGEHDCTNICLFRLAPPFSAYDWPTNNIEIGIGGVHQQHNVTVALQLAKLWLEKTNRQGKLN
ncbi:unnamed protein product [Gongylonema pulchrum]|uniref:MOFRL domain-containing protein n=1 Tax=Gongylonema pulchrum TaxID=637853 RepID=A0A183EVF9_9BILA|nr:unnamed protein product [Gongylonema pulchrum]